MRKITIKDIDYLVPGTWDEMTAEQLCFLANILNSKSTAQEAKVKMLLFCLSARIRRYQKANGTGYAVSLPKDRIWITAEQLAALSTIFDFLFQETEKGIELDIRLTRNPFPVYKGKGARLQRAQRQGYRVIRPGRRPDQYQLRTVHHAADLATADETGFLRGIG